MDLERLVALIVKTVVEELIRHGIIQADGSMDRPPPPEPAAPSSPAMNSRRVISAQMVLEAAKTGQTVLEVPLNALITPLAQDVAKEKGVTIKPGRDG